MTQRIPTDVGVNRNVSVDEAVSPHTWGWSTVAIAITERGKETP